MLQTGNMTTYPETCARATASFSVLSDSIKMVQELLSEPKRNRPELADFLQQLQSFERDKLHLTAAIHLERIRERNHGLQERMQNGKDASTSGGPGSNDRVSRLLKEGVASLETRINGCVESINEVLEELRFAVLEED